MISAAEAARVAMSASVSIKNFLFIVCAILGVSLTTVSTLTVQKACKKSVGTIKIIKKSVPLDFGTLFATN